MHATHPQVLLGAEVRSLRVGEMRLTEANYAPDMRLPAHAHEVGNISLIVRGELEETVGRTSQSCTTCSVVVKPAGTVHSNRFGLTGARTMLLEVPHRSSLRRWQWFHGGEVCAAALRVYRAFRFKSDELEDRVTEFIGVIEDALETHRTPTAPPWVQQVRDHLHDRFRERVCICEIAKTFDVHPVYLTRAFRTRFGCAITGYLQRLRVRDAAHRLASSEAPLAQIAFRSGFADQPHMCRLFKRDVGFTPASFRRLVQGN